ncbi:MAG: Crp/Fnr family transcriptional regulator [Solirubrobacterales bacterium]|nr:Crp/Fnr family transcriptional regulator [Solirubrobacterales bacterium]
MEVLTGSEQEEARHVSLPVLEISERGPDLEVLLGRANAFGAIVLSGMLQHQMRIGDQPGLRVLGPGEIVSAGHAPTSMLLVSSEWRAAGSTRLALLDNEFLFAVRRWPRLLAAFEVRMAEQTERLEMQLAICQLPRVEDRLLAMLWLLAESWGRVTSAGTTLPLSLTHEALGALIGARRPTVTLALGELAQRGAVVHQDRGWLLLQKLPETSGEARNIEAPRVLDDGPSEWTDEPEPADGEGRAELLTTVRRLRIDHLRNREDVQERLRRIATARARSKALQEQVQERRRLRPRPPRRSPSS